MSSNTSPYLQLERTTGGVIPVNGAVLFNEQLGKGGTQINYTVATGDIVFAAPGYYYINWFVAPQFGLTTNGSNFAILSSDGEVLTGSSHIRNSPTVGFAVIEVATPGKTVSLLNTSDNSITLSEAVKAKAAIAVYAIADPT